MNDFDPRNSADTVSYSQATGRDSVERSDTEQMVSKPVSTEVTPRQARRRFSATDKLRILAAADRCAKQGELGALLRREGIYSSMLAKWRRRQRDGALEEKKRGRKPAVANPLVGKLAESEKRVRALEKKLEQAEAIIGFQKKFLEIVGKLPSPTNDETTS
jgi:transposase